MARKRSSENGSSAKLEKAIKANVEGLGFVPEEATMSPGNSDV